MIKYDTYKYSGYHWLGDIPKGWDVFRIKDIIQKIGSGVTPKGGSEIYVNKGVPFLRSQNIYDDGLRIDNVSFITETIHNKMKNSQLKPNDILINITGASIGRTCIIPLDVKEANINQHIIYVRCKESIVPFVSNYFKTNTIKEHINRIQAGTSKEALNMGQVLTIPIVFPPLPEQKIIANYLDHKTKAIDQKINLLTQKTTKYKELRKAIINQTVTKGLDENVQLKDSGIEWIGDIPKHWEVKRLKDYFELSKGVNSSKYNNDYVKDVKNQGDFPVYSGQTENYGVMAKINSYEYNFDETLLLVTTVGANAMGLNKLKGKFTLSQNCAIMRINKKAFVHYQYYYLLQLFQEERKIIPTIMQPSLRIEDLKKYFILFPPLSEQTAIANYLDEKTSTIDAIISNIESQINHLKELRVTVINDVVTGKIRVSD